MIRRKRADIHVNQERWLVSYADFITLLFAFFVVMYSISQVNESKYRVLSDTFVHAFKSPTEFSADRTREDSGTPLDTTLNPIQVGKPSRSPASSAIDVRSENIGQVPQEFSEISDLFTERFGDLIDDNLISVSSNELWLQIELKDSILFTSGNAEPSPQAQVIFDEIALILKDYPNPVQVEGYTDNLPINSARYPSNWELSTARASAIVKLLASKEVAPTRLSAVGFGEFQPIADNSSAEGRAQNRRVALMIAQKALPRPGAKIEEAITGDSAGVASASEPAVTPALQEPGQVADTLTAPPTQPESVQTDNQPPKEAVTPIELDDGGLLFTSDPELPRNR
jgi:chemotaxis protein MotB